MEFGASERRRGRTRRFRHLRSDPHLMALLAVVGTAGVFAASWWTRELAGYLGGQWSFDFVAGLAVAVVPLILTVAGIHRERRAVMLLGMACYAWSLTTQPYMSWAFANHELARTYAHQVPGYLPGLGAGLLIGMTIVTALSVRGRV